jgi:8-oxo-dGTP diphosphatase
MPYWMRAPLATRRAGGLDDPLRPLECVAFLLVAGDRVLAERRRMTKRVVPGAVALPGGHVEEGERPEDALRRELHEELGVVPLALGYVCTLLHRSQEFRKLHYFAVEHWQGEPTNHEAEALLWVPLDGLPALDLEVDRVAVREYLRLFRSPP